MQENEKPIARWVSKSGKHWVELTRSPYRNGFAYGYTTPGAGGNLGVTNEAEAIARIQSMVDSGYFQPDANITPMRREG